MPQQGQYSPFAPTQGPQPMPPPPTQRQAPQQQQMMLPPPTGGASYGGVSTVNPQAGPADYAGVQQFSDAAHQEAMRYLGPQIVSDNQRMAQTLINQGVDPNSEKGRLMMDQLARQQADARNAASFGAMQFGQGIQNQMFGQDLSRSQLASGMQQAKWSDATNRYGIDKQFSLGQEGLSMDKYGMDIDYDKFMSDLGLRQ